MCPTQPVDNKVKILSSIEKLSQIEVKEAPKLLPHSTMVADTISVIESGTKMARFLKGWTVPSQMGKNLSKPRFYKTHSPTFPVKAPQLDIDASKVGLSVPTNVTVPMKTLESLEGRLRSLVTIASHADLFSAASYQLLSEEDFSPAALQRLLQAVSRTARHSLVLLLASASDILQLRRDTILYSSSVLMDHSKAKLRATPLNATELFGGLIAEIFPSNNCEPSLHRLRPHPVIPRSLMT